MTYTTQRKEFLFISLFLLNKKNLAGARFKEGVNNKTNLYHLWYIATTLSPKKVTTMKQQPNKSIEQIWSKECNYRDLTMVYGFMLANQCKSI